MSETIRDQAGDERRAEIARKMAFAPKPPRNRPRCCPKPFQAKRYDHAGQPTKYLPEYCQVAIDTMARGHSVTGLAGHFRVAKDTVYEWMRVHPAFSAAVNIGRACRVEMLEEKLLSTKQGVGVTAAIFALKNADPDEYKDLFQQEHRVDVRIERIPDARLLEIVQSAPKQIAPAIAPADKDSE